MRLVAADLQFTPLDGFDAVAGPAKFVSFSARPATAGRGVAHSIFSVNHITFT
jgi:hypothetical protein